MKSIASSALCLLLLGAAHAASVEGTAPGRADMAVGIQAHLSQLPASGPIDAGAFLDQVQKTVTSPDAPAEQVAAGVALIAGMTTPAKSAALESYVEAALTPEQMERLGGLFSAVHDRDNAVVLKNYMRAEASLTRQLAGKLDAARLSAIWDGSIAGAGETAAASAAPIQAPTVVGAGAAHLAPRAPESAPELQLQRRVEPPAPQRAQRSLLSITPAQQQKAAAEEDQKVYVVSRLTEEDKARALARLSALMRHEWHDPDQVRQAHGDAAGWGSKVQKRAADRSKELLRPLNETLVATTSGGDLGQAMEKLQKPMIALNPEKVDFDPGWFTRMLAKLPFGELPADRFARNYNNAKEAIDAIEADLKKSRQGLSDHIEALRAAKQAMLGASHELEREAGMGLVMLEELDRLIATDPKLSPEQRDFLKNDIAYGLTRRIDSLLQTLIINQDGAMFAEGMVRQHEELVYDVDNTIAIVPAVLDIAGLVASSLDRQKGIRQKVKETNEIGMDGLERAGKQMREHADTLNAEGPGATLPIDRLKSVYRDYEQFVGAISRYKQEALPKLSAQINEFDELARKGAHGLQAIDPSLKDEPAKASAQ